MRSHGRSFVTVRSADEFFSTYNTTKGLYMVDELPPTLHADVAVPKFLHCDEITDMFFVSYLWISAGGAQPRNPILPSHNLSIPELLNPACPHRRRS